MFCSYDFPKSLRKLGLFALSIGKKHSVWHISLLVYSLWRIVYIPYMGTVVLTERVSLFPFLRCVSVDIDKEKGFFLLVCCVYLAMYASYIYQKHAQLSSRSGLDSMGIIHFPSFSTLIIFVGRFYIFHSLFL